MKKQMMKVEEAKGVCQEPSSWNKWSLATTMGKRLDYVVDSGDNCFAEGQYGVCLRVSECLSISNEIKRTGRPISSYMRIKLQNLTCGFENLDPLVCCSSLHGSDSEHIQDASTESVFQHSEETHNCGGEENQYNSNNVDSFTRRTLEKSRPKTIDEHPNLALLPQRCGSIESDRILGGNRTNLFEMPWMVLLSYATNRGIKLSCGGTIINRWYVLTAAHCVTALRRMRLDGVILGEYDIRHDPDCEISDGRENCAPNVVNATIDSVIAHTGYTRQGLADDIALIRLSQPADFTLDSQQPICLPITQQLRSLSLAELNGIVAGWGVTEDGLQSPVLLSVELPIVSSNECYNIYNGSVRLTEKQLCAGGVKDKDSCGGDSGGPLMYPGQYGTNGLRYIQHGIVSFGSKRCGISGFPGVYTNVAHYMDWILDNIRS